jgi:hypothetical protein
VSFTNFGGGLVNTIIAGVGNDFSTGISNSLTSKAAFSVNPILSGAVQNASGFTLDDGSNYLLSQVSSLVPPSVGNGLVNAVATQVAVVGINATRGFVEQGLSNFLGGGIGSNLVSGLAPSGTANRGSISVPMGIVNQLPDSEYGGGAYTLTDIVFSVVPCNAGPQTQAQPQSAPAFSENTNFSADFAGTIPSLDSLKGRAALAGPGSGLNVGGRNFGANYRTSGGVATNAFKLPVNW